MVREYAPLCNNNHTALDLNYFVLHGLLLLLFVVFILILYSLYSLIFMVTVPLVPT